MSNTDGAIREGTADGIVKVLTGIGGKGVCGMGTGAGDGGPALSAMLCDPTALKLDAAGNLYIVEDQRIRKISAAGIISTVAGGIGNNVPGFGGDGGMATSAQLNLGGARDLAVDPAGHLYLPPTLNTRI